MGIQAKSHIRTGEPQAAREKHGGIRIRIYYEDGKGQPLEFLRLALS